MANNVFETGDTVRLKNWPREVGEITQILHLSNGSQLAVIKMAMGTRKFPISQLEIVPEMAESVIGKTASEEATLNMPMDDTGNPKVTEPDLLSGKDWQKFVAEKANELLSTYQLSPDRLHQDAVREERTQEDYSGREFLELFQNADDAATEANISGRIRIDVLQDGFLFSNTGRPFSKGGIRSILMADLSPKRELSNLLIGAKGLGFRSMLNWTDAPAILSGALEVGFSRNFSQETFAELAEKNQKLKPDFQKKNLEPPILCFPEWLGEEKGRAYETLLNRARELRISGFDTVIVVPFQESSSLDEATTQAKDLGARILLFVQSVCEVEIQILGEPFCKWVREEEDDIVRLRIMQEGDETVEEWLVRRKRNSLPDDLHTNHRLREDYEIAVALRVDELCGAGPISCYFPTREEMPFVGLFHATLELQGNREHLQRNSKANKYVIERLAELHAEFLEHLANNGRLNDPLGFMSIGQTPSEALKPFLDNFYKAVASKKLIPTRGNGFVAPAEAKMFPSFDDDFADHRWFRDFVLPHSEASRNVLNKLFVVEATQDEVVTYLSKLKLTIRRRAKLIAHLLELGYDTPLLGLLMVDERERLGELKTKWFPPLTKTPVSSIPRWAKFRFVHSGLWKEICSELDVKTDEAVSLLDRFSVERYDPRTVIETLLARLDELAKSPIAKMADRREEFLKVLAMIFQGPNAEIESIADLKIPWPSINGKWSFAANLHLCDSQSKSGPVNQILYKNRPDLLASDSSLLSLSIPTGKSVRFLSWIGVNNWPGKIWRELIRDDWESMRVGLPDILTYQYSNGRKEKVTVAEANFSSIDWQSGFTGRTEWVLGLSDILSCGCDDAIIAWLTGDSKMRAAKSRSEIMYKPVGNAQRRIVEGKIQPSLVAQTISRSEWLRDYSGDLRAPVDLFTGDDLGGKILPQPKLPNIIGPLPFALSHEAAHTGCIAAGVAQGLNTAKPPAIYRLLKVIGVAKPDPKIAMPIYRQLARRSDLDGDVRCMERDDFFSHGMLLSSKAGESVWCSPRESIHFSGQSAVTGIVEQARPVFKLSDAPVRFLEFLGVTQFGARKIKILDINARPGSPELTSYLRERFEGFVEWLVLWGERGSASQARLASVNLLRLFVVTELTVTLKAGKERYEGKLREWECLYHDEKIYIVVPQKTDITTFEDLAPSPFTQCTAQHLGMSGADKLVDLFRASSSEARKVLTMRAFPEFSLDDVEKILRRDPAERAIPSERHDTSPLPPLAVENVSDAPNELEDPGDAEFDALRQRVGSEKKTEPTGWKSSPVTNRASTDKTKFKMGGRSSKRSHLKKQSSGQEEELIVERFELELGRFCERVDRERGEASEGCDIVSFTSNTDLENYRLSRDSTLVDRFIEVKRGTMDLSANERKSAERNRDRFFVYSVQYDKEGQPKIETFRDPLKWSVEDDWFLRVNSENAPSSHTEGFKPEIASEDEE